MACQGNMPSFKYVTVENLVITYNGTPYPIKTFVTNKKYIIWNIDRPTQLEDSNIRPQSSLLEYLIVINDNGKPTIVEHENLVYSFDQNINGSNLTNSSEYNTLKSEVGENTTKYNLLSNTVDGMTNIIGTTDELADGSIIYNLNKVKADSKSYGISIGQIETKIDDKYVDIKPIILNDIVEYLRSVSEYKLSFTNLLEDTLITEDELKLINTNKTNIAAKLTQLQSTLSKLKSIIDGVNDTEKSKLVSDMKTKLTTLHNSLISLCTSYLQDSKISGQEKTYIIEKTYELITYIDTVQNTCSNITVNGQAGVVYSIENELLMLKDSTTSSITELDRSSGSLIEKYSKIEQTVNKISSTVGGIQTDVGGIDSGLNLIASTYSVAFDSSNNPKSQENIKLTTSKIKASGQVSWLVNPSTVTLTGSGDVRYLSPFELQKTDKIIVTIQLGELSHSVIISKVKDGVNGANGANGADGVDGKNGADGTSVKILGSYDSEIELNNAHPSNNENGDGYIVNGDLYVWNGKGFVNVGKIQGEHGKDGVSSYVHIKYSNDGKAFTSNNGETIGSWMGVLVDNVKADSSVFSAYTWNKIKGEQGLQGLQGENGKDGIAGTNGTDGKTSYFHIKYSSVANPSTSSQMTETPSTYIGTYVDFTVNDSTDPSKYNWARFEGLQGTNGENGIPGKNGTDGKTSYLHIKYSNDGGTTFTSSNGETVGIYIGQYTDFNITDSSSVSSYKWSKIKGDDGLNGTNGNDGVSVEEVIIEYAKTNSTVTPPTSGWGSAMPTYENGYYLWVRTRVKYSNNPSYVYSTPVCDQSWKVTSQVYSEVVQLKDSITQRVTSIEYTASQDKQGIRCNDLGAKINYSTFNTYNDGEIYLHGYDSNNNPTDTNGSIYWSGKKVSITKGMVNPNSDFGKNDCYLCTDGKGGTFVAYYSGGWKYKWLIGATSSGTLSLNDSHIAFGQFKMLDAESFEYAYLYPSPVKLENAIGISSIESRVKTAESKITDSSIINTVTNSTEWKYKGDISRLRLKINYSTLTTESEGELFLYGVDASGKDLSSGTVKVFLGGYGYDIPIKQHNPAYSDLKVPTNQTIYIVYSTYYNEVFSCWSTVNGWKKLRTSYDLMQDVNNKIEGMTWTTSYYVLGSYIMSADEMVSTGIMYDNAIQDLSDIPSNSEVKQLSDEVSIKVSKGKVVSEINLSSEEAKIKANKIQLEGAVTAGDSDGNSVLIENANYTIKDSGQAKAFFGFKNMANNSYDKYVIPKLALGAYGYKSNHNYFTVVSYKGIDNPQNISNAYVDMAYHNIAYDDFSNIKMYDGGDIRISPVKNLEITTNFVNGVYAGEGENRIALFTTSSLQDYNSNLQVGVVANHSNAKGLILADRYRDAPWGSDVSDSSKRTAIRIQTDVNGEKFIRPLTSGADIQNGSGGFPWKSVHTSLGAYSSGGVVVNEISTMQNNDLINVDNVLDNIGFYTQNPMDIESDSNLIMDVTNVQNTNFAEVSEDGDAYMNTSELLKLALFEIKQLKEEIRIMKEGAK